MPGVARPYYRVNTVSSLRMQATSATRPGFPAAFNRFQNSRTVGLPRIADTVAIYKTVLT